MEAYIKQLADLLGLEGWEIIVDKKPANKGEYANISAVYGQRRAVLRLAKNHADWTPECVRSTLVHELMHCHLEPISQLAHDLLAVTAGERSLAVANTALSFLLEQTVDNISTAVARAMPLPPAES
jgi:hypothetical protein